MTKRSENREKKQAAPEQLNTLKKLTDTAAVRDAILAKRGNVAAVALGFHVSRTTVYARIKEEPALREVLNEARETMLDHAESQLYAQAMNGNTTALIFLLKTQGKARGYIERQEYVFRDWRDELRYKISTGQVDYDAVLAELGEPIADEFFGRRVEVHDNAD
jgi:GTP cyclohydrolase II